jgi:hypothetical protein
VFVDIPADDTHRIVSVPLDGSGSLQPLPITLTGQIGGIDVAADGSLYVDQWDRPTEILRVSPDGGTPEHVASMPWNPVNHSALPLPDGRILFTSRTFGRERVVLIASGKEPSAFVETTEETAGPLTLVGQTHVAFTIGAPGGRTIALGSVNDRRITRRLEGSKGAAIDSMVATPDGKTIYYAASGSIWAIAADDGAPRRIRSGDSVTLDPSGLEFVVRISDKNGTHLVRAPVAGGPDTPIPVPPELRVAPILLQANAVGKDGRILAQLASPASWFWPAGLVDPRTGRAQVIQVGYDADVDGGWTPDGKLLLDAAALRVSLWRFRPDQGDSPH